MRQAELNNWSLDAAQMADLCSSINQFFTATGVTPPQSAPHTQAQVQHPTPTGATQHPAQPHGAMHPKASQHNHQHGQHNHHGQHISTGDWGGGGGFTDEDSALIEDLTLSPSVLLSVSRKHVHGHKTEHLLSDGSTRVPTHAPNEQHSSNYDR